MSRLPSLLAPLLACSTLLLTGAPSHQAPQTSSPASPAFTPQSPAADATGLLDEILARLAAAPSAHGPGIQWLAMNLWQKMGDGENSFEAHGRLVRGPRNRLRLEMSLRAQTTVKLLQVCDGATFWESLRIGADKPVRSLYPVPQTAPDQQRFLEEKTLADLRPLFERIRAGLRNPVQQRGVWQHVQAVRIMGDWKPNDSIPCELRTPLRPRACHVYLEAHTRWPFRIEWWGGERPSDPPTLLLEIEFRDVVINQPPSPEEVARLFASPAAD